MKEGLLLRWIGFNRALFAPFSEPLETLRAKLAESSLLLLGQKRKHLIPELRPRDDQARLHVGYFLSLRAHQGFVERLALRSFFQSGMFFPQLLDKRPDGFAAIGKEVLDL